MRKVKLTQDAVSGLLDNLLKRSPNNYGQYVDAVNEIVESVRSRGDEAVFEYTEKFDGAKLCADSIVVTQEEIEEAYTQISTEVLEVIRKAIVNIRTYQRKKY